MLSIKPFAIAGVFAAAALFSSPSAHAIGLSAGAAAARAGAENPALVEVQYRQRGPFARTGPVVYQPRRTKRSASNRRAAAAIGAVAAIGVLGAVAAANARPRYHQSQTYYDPGYGYGNGYYRAASPVYVQPRCFLRNERLFNEQGVYRGVYQVRVCH